MTPEALYGSLEDGERGGVFFLHGEDEYRKEKAVRAVVDAHLDPTTKDFNFDPLRGGDVSVDELASILATPPMMAEWRVVLVRDAEAFAGHPTARRVILEAAEDPPPGLVLILRTAIPSGSTAKFYKDLRRAATAVEFAALGEGDVPGWLMETVRTRHGMEMEVEAARKLAAGIGSDLGLLSQELAKLASFAGERGTITVDDVRAAGTRIPSQDRWGWFDLVGERRFGEALEGLPTLLTSGESGVGLTIGLGRHLLRVGLALVGGKGALESALPGRQRWLSGRIAGQARGWKRADLDDALLDLVRVDRLLKSSSLSDEHFLEEWLLVREGREA